MKNLLFIVLGLVACGSKSSPPRPATPPETKGVRLGKMCDRYYARERTCVDDYLSQLLDVRVEYDMPKGIAEELKRDGRDAVLARMRPEWERDTTLENTNRICRDVETKIPPEMQDKFIEEGERCYAKTDCAGFVACTIEGQRDYIKSSAAPH